MTSKKATSAKRAALPRPFSYSKQFKEDFDKFNRAARSDMGRLKTLMLLLIADDGPLGAEWSDHAIDKGEFAGTGMRDAHVQGDFLLLYRITLESPSAVVFERIGSHSELF